MLVLSRRPGQKVLFPSLGVSIEVLSSRGVVTRLGIDAPEDVTVMRDEVLARSAQGATCDEGLSPAARKERHDLRNRLNQAMLKLQLLQRQLELGRAVEPERNLSGVLSELAELEKSTVDSVAEAVSLKVLVVEDQANERELLATCLRLGGIEVSTVSNGREAFDYLHEHELPDLVLLDMRMPDVDGPTFLRSIRDDIRMRDMRVFAVSGSDRDEFATSPLPVDGWFSKPVRIDALLHAAMQADPRHIGGHSLNLPRGLATSDS